MRLKLSAFLQLKFNLAIYRRLGWRNAFLYMLILGKIYFTLNEKERRKIELALDTLFEDQTTDHDRSLMKREVFQGILAHYYEKLFNIYSNVSELKTFFRNNIESKYFHKLDAALNRGKGVMFVTAHYGGIEYIPIFLGAHNYPVSVIAKFATKHLKEASIEQIKDFGINVIDVSESNGTFSAIIQELKSNRIVFTECDEIEEWRPSSKERMSFLGKIIGVDRTINLIQKRTGAEVLFGLLHRINLHKYKFIMETREDMQSLNGNTSASIGELILKTLEQYILTYPEEWYQWKNYLGIRPVSAHHVEQKRPISHTVLKPAFGKVA
jgi:KDO2-lipid IV(A) lauroyltransferase